MAKNKIFKKVQESNASVGWSWNNESGGIVQWSFSNPTSEQKSVVLLRSSYYFGNAYWPVYLANAEFDTQFAQSVTPLVDNGVENNAPPLFVASINGKFIVAFLFTLSPGQTWSMLEGGFVDGITPSGIALYDVSNMEVKEMCVGYDITQVADWDAQTQTLLGGYVPNPKTFNVVVGSISGAYIQLFNDPISTGTCPTPTPKDCNSLLEQAVSSIEGGNILKGLETLFDYVECEISNAQADVNADVGKLKQSIRSKIDELGEYLKDKI